MSHPHLTSSLQALRVSLDALRRQQLDTHAFCANWRSQQELLTALPPRYRQVLEDVLGRMEAGSLFTEESCSFSQKDLQDSLAIWLDKAEQTLTTQAA